MVFRAAMQTTAAASLLGALLVMAAGGGCQSRAAEEANTKKATEKLAKLAADYEAAEKAESEKRWAATHPPAAKKKPAPLTITLAKPPAAGSPARGIDGSEVASPAAAASGLEIAMAALPPAIADWKEKDYFTARLFRDPRLVPAVERLAKDSVGDETAVRVFSGLLVPQGTADPPKGKPGANSTVSPLMQAAARALAMNQTPAARQMLTLLLSGLYATDDDQAGAFAALQGLIEHPPPENDDLLLRVLVSPEQLRPSGRGQVTAAALRDQAISLLAAGGNNAFRAKLAAHLARQETPADLRAKLLPLLRDPSPANFDAQAVLYRGSGLPADFLAQAENAFAASSSDALDLLAGTPRAAALKFDSASALRTSAQLWSEDFLSSLTQRLKQVETFRDGSPTLLLASTVPNDMVRAVLYESLERNWEDGPADLAKAGLGSRVLSEPGFGVLVKLLYRRELSGTDNVAQGQPARVRLLVGQHVMAAQRYLGWMQSVQQQWTARFAPKGAATIGSRTRGNGSSRSSLPLQVDAPGDVVAEHYLDWASAMRDTLLGIHLDPLSVQYVKIEERARPSKIVLFYRRQLNFGDQLIGTNGPKGFEMRRDGQTVWFDGVTVGTTPDRARSLDVVIRPANPDLPAMHDEERRMIVEILAVEINDPARPREARQD